MRKFSWTQLMAFEELALANKVPRGIPGLIPREIGSNHRWILKGFSSERNGESTLMNPLILRRLALFGFLTIFGYQYLRILTFGVTELNEHHAHNKDNLVYDKLSNRYLPYVYPAGVL